ncbi:MAG TPA: hypothetical protein VJT49_26145 [Amycolatopsis sp.]|uniref:hypothetical protein n=1 Tax=Amycolatopsis sp. TaxID=37632 RepID=UPI002B4680BA|nr:hypothetical protein [Amycolatopsis sp.]HKS48530.1 hypothetical protein [Amycolatopsis sp.]
MLGAQYSPGGGGTAPLPRISANPKRTGYVLKALGLVVVAVASGVFWWLIRHDSTTPAPVAQAPAKEFAFAMAEGPVVSTNCATNSTGEVKKWFNDHPCQRLARALYNTAYGNSRVLVSVAVVTNNDPDLAKQLKMLADKDGTGNVNDLVKDGTAHVPGAPKKLSDGKYRSRVNGTQVTIVLSEFFDQHNDDAVLERVNAEALDLAGQLG